MEPIDINYLLKKKNSSQAKIARKLRVARQAVNQVVHGTIRSARIMKEISRVVGKKVEELWPSRENENDKAA